MKEIYRRETHDSPKKSTQMLADEKLQFFVKEGRKIELDHSASPVKSSYQYFSSLLVLN